MDCVKTILAWRLCSVDLLNDMERIIKATVKRTKWKTRVRKIRVRSHVCGSRSICGQTPYPIRPLTKKSPLMDHDGPRACVQIDPRMFALEHFQAFFTRCNSSIQLCVPSGINKRNWLQFECVFDKFTINCLPTYVERNETKKLQILTFIYPELDIDDPSTSNIR